MDYTEADPSVKQALRDALPSRASAWEYLVSLFPFVHWIRRYNIQWLLGDLIAGLTVGAIMVPQSMAYAALAELPPQFGLYSSFVGGMTYWFFATSKDISIGPIAVMATIVASVVSRIKEEHPLVEPHVVASLIALMAGTVIAVIGLLRLGWIIDFISHTAIAAFMTGSALTIASTQIAALLGIKHVHTGGPAFKNYYAAFRNINHAKIDAALGLTALFLLYFVKYFAQYLEKKRPRPRKLWFFASTLRTVSVIGIYTFISWLVNRTRRDAPAFAIVSTVPRGLQDISVPAGNMRIFLSILKELPIVCIVLLIEHVSIAKSFGRINNYTINPSQEMLGIGVANVVGAFFGAFPATGSFSRTAINSKAGVRTPYGAAFTAVLVLVAIYVLPAVFFYIPKAPLAAIIIHAVGDLLTPPREIKEFWGVAPGEVFLFFAAVLVSFFYSIEMGVYITVFVSIIVLLGRSARAKGQVLGQVTVWDVQDKVETDIRKLYVPPATINPVLTLSSPAPGVIIYRPVEGFLFHNANQHVDTLLSYIQNTTRRTVALSDKPEDRLWSSTHVRSDLSLPTLRAVIFDFSAVSEVDVSSVQILKDFRAQMDAYAKPGRVLWAFASVTKPWTRRALASAGFGKLEGTKRLQVWTAVHTASKTESADPEKQQISHSVQEVREDDISPVPLPDNPRASIMGPRTTEAMPSTIVSVTGTNRSAFFADITGAVRAVLENVGKEILVDTDKEAQEAV